jgi:hypothetical protein
MAPREGLLCFLPKNGSSGKTFGRTPPEKRELETGRSPTKQARRKQRCAKPILLPDKAVKRSRF